VLRRFVLAGRAVSRLAPSAVAVSEVIVIVCDDVQSRTMVLFEAFVVHIAIGAAPMCWCVEIANRMT
jgi:hypothetical protein